MRGFAFLTKPPRPQRGRRTRRTSRLVGRGWTVALALTVLVSTLGVVSTGCGSDDEQRSAKPDAATGGGGQGGASGSSGSGAAPSGGGGGAGGSAGTGSGGTGASGSGGVGGGPSDAGGDAPTDSAADAASCTAQCGPVELCDAAHRGSDDDCDGLVDEGCPCTPGTAQACFKGDPSLRGSAGCYDGTAFCDDTGVWGPCAGGWHATDGCTSVLVGCKPLTTAPFVSTDLSAGTGAFSSDATPGSESYSVTCPAGVTQCPVPQSGASFVALQSGEYAVKYSKVIQGTTTTASCEFPLIVTAPGLRVELSWNHPASGGSFDLDLHLHEPGTTKPWGFAANATQDCNWSNCSASAFALSTATLSWFADPPATPPTPVNWWLDPIAANNNCHFAPKGAGATWQSLNKGCHNPRLDMENVSCDPSISDPTHGQFCVPENVNIDFPPLGKWMRIGVHYFSNGGQTSDVHPEVRVFCHGKLAAQLGSKGYYSPSKAVSFAPSDGAGSGNRFWSVADVAFATDACGKPYCTVAPIYADASTRTPFFGTDTTAALSFVPAYPPPL